MSGGPANALRRVRISRNSCLTGHVRHVRHVPLAEPNALAFSHFGGCCMMPAMTDMGSPGGAVAVIAGAIPAMPPLWLAIAGLPRTSRELNRA
jgi:hypothetical protein